MTQREVIEKIRTDNLIAFQATGVLLGKSQKDIGRTAELQTLNKNLVGAVNETLSKVNGLTGNTLVLESLGKLRDYAGLATQVLLTDNSNWRYYSSYTVPVNNKWVVAADGKQGGVWVDESVGAVSLLDFGVRPGSSTSNNQRQQNRVALQSAVDSGMPLVQGLSEIWVDGPISLLNYGNVGFSLKGEQAGKNTSFIIFNSDEGGFSYNSNSPDLNTQGYPARIQQLYFENIKLYKIGGSGRSASTGLEIKNFGMVGLTNVQIEGFNTGLDCVNGSELYALNLRTLGNGTGMRFTRNTTLNNPDADMAAITLFHCHTHDNDNYGIEVNSARQVVAYGGSWGASQGQAALFVHGQYSAVDLVSVNDVNFENNPSNAQVLIGKAGSEGNITQINLNSCQLAIGANNKIKVHSKLGILNITGANIDGNHAPTIEIAATQTLTPQINIGEGISPYWAKYNVKDLRNLAYPSPLRLFKKPLINAFNTDFRRSYYGYTPNALIADSTTHYVTGGRSVYFTGDGTEKYLEITLSNDTKVTEGKQVDIDYTVDFAAPFAVLGVVTESLSGVADPLAYVPQCFPVQLFTGGAKDGFTRCHATYIVPEGKNLLSFRIMNNANYNDDLYIDSVRLHSEDFLVQALPSTGNGAPQSGQWLAGDKVTNRLVGEDQPDYYYCTVGGTPGTWVPVYRGESPGGGSGDEWPTVDTYQDLLDMEVSAPTYVTVLNDERTGKLEVPYQKTATRIRQLTYLIVQGD